MSKTRISLFLTELERGAALKAAQEHKVSIEELAHALLLQYLIQKGDLDEASDSEVQD